MNKNPQSSNKRNPKKYQATKTSNTDESFDLGPECAILKSVGPGQLKLDQDFKKRARAGLPVWNNTRIFTSSLSRSGFHPSRGSSIVCESLMRKNTRNELGPSKSAPKMNFGTFKSYLIKLNYVSCSIGGFGSSPITQFCIFLVTFTACNFMPSPSRV